MQTTRDSGRIVRLWDAGVFARMPPRRSDTAIVALTPTAEGCTVVMRDLAALAACPTGRLVTRPVIAGGYVVPYHRGAAPRPSRIGPADDLCSLSDLARLPVARPADRARTAPTTSFPRLSPQGRELFAYVVPADVVDASPAHRRGPAGSLGATLGRARRPRCRHRPT